tara:strand:+ start:1012 stop:1275 length:264 start_codon:yes stop_codon:yes gene_type:complete
MKFRSIIIAILFLLSSNSYADEIIKNSIGEYFILKNDGSYTKLPPPKPGFTYKIIKKKKQNLNVPKKKSIFSRIEKKARKKTNQGYR